MARRYSGVVCSGTRVRPPRESSVSTTNTSPGATRATGGNRRSNTGVSLSRVMRCMGEELVSHTKHILAAHRDEVLPSIVSESAAFDSRPFEPGVWILPMHVCGSFASHFLEF